LVLAQLSLSAVGCERQQRDGYDPLAKPSRKGRFLRTAVVPGLCLNRTRMLAEVIASAFASGLSWSGSLGGKEIYCPPPGLKGQQAMSAFEQFLNDNPDMAEKPYGDAMATSLGRAFPCQGQ